VRRTASKIGRQDAGKNGLATAFFCLSRRAVVRSAFAYRRFLDNHAAGKRENDSECEKSFFHLVDRLCDGHTCVPSAVSEWKRLPSM
jgi:hypothetical protein